MTVRFSVLDSPLTQPIKTGEVTSKAIELEVLHPQTTDANSREMLELRHDVAEMSIATFVKAVEQGLGLAALPLFASGRRFVQSGFYLAERSVLSSLDDLAGHSVGLPQYWISSCVWQRLVLQQVHGIRPEQVRWVSVETERMEGLGAPSDVDLRLEERRSLGELMGAGEIDACLLQGARSAPPDLQAVSVPAYVDCVAAERDYYQMSGVLPIMHLTVIRRDLAEESPATVSALLDLYERAKVIAERRPDAIWPLPPLGHGIEELRRLVGGDPFAYGISPNRRALDAFLDAALAQGLTGRRLGVEELFVANLPERYR